MINKIIRWNLECDECKLVFSILDRDIPYENEEISCPICKSHVCWCSNFVECDERSNHEK